MYTKLLSSLLAAASLVGSTACVKRADNSAERREAYNRSLSDSIAVVQTEIESCDTQIAELRDQVSGWLRDFTTVSNPREAGSYIILTSFQSRYPLTATGLAARINDSGQFELIAALAAKPFDRITVTGPEVSASSATVPYDKALNYRTAVLTTVSFTGAEADSIGQLVADNELNPLTVTYLQGNGKSGSWRIPHDYAKAIAYTYLLYSTQSELNRCERRKPMLHEKLTLLRNHKK